MIPYGDSPERRIIPLVNWALILLNVLVFVYELSLPERDLVRFFNTWGVVPRDLTPADMSSFITLISSQFLHGGWAHLLGNMLFLWVFGDNVEDAVGHVRYVIFYLLCGAIAALAHVFFNLGDSTPSVGASGAIAGVMGAYLVLYPSASIKVFVPIFLFFGLIRLPALVLIGIWFAMQLFSGISSIGEVGGGEAGIAFWAHVGGFVAGLLLIFIFRQPGRTMSRALPSDRYSDW
jgi:membrane associated rhomboid family serine protease